MVQYVSRELDISVVYKPFLFLKSIFKQVDEGRDFKESSSKE